MLCFHYYKMKLSDGSPNNTTVAFKMVLYKMQWMCQREDIFYLSYFKVISQSIVFLWENL